MLLADDDAWLLHEARRHHSEYKLRFEKKITHIQSSIGKKIHSSRADEWMVKNIRLHL